MRLVVLTPEARVVDQEVLHVRAEDDSGAFGILEHHVESITALTVSVLVFRDTSHREHFVAVRGGLFMVRERGRRIDVLTREAVRNDDLGMLQRDVLTRFRKTAYEEQQGGRGVRGLEETLRRHVSEYVGTRRRRA